MKPTGPHEEDRSVEELWARCAIARSDKFLFGRDEFAQSSLGFGTVDDWRCVAIGVGRSRSRGDSFESDELLGLNAGFGPAPASGRQ